MTRYLLTTCKGRLSFLRRVLPSWRSALPDWRVLVVDWGDPDGSAAFAEAEGCEALRCAELGEPTAEFWKSRAWNLGADLAISRGAEWLALVDADHMLGGAAGSPARVLDELCALGPGHWGRESSINRPGFIVCHASDYRAAGGADESFKGWGCEDWVLRARLTLAAGAKPVCLPLAIEYLNHSDNVRAAFQPGCCRASADRNSILCYRACRKLEIANKRKLYGTQLEGLVFDYAMHLNNHEALNGARNRMIRDAWKSGHAQVYG